MAYTTVDKSSLFMNTLLYTGTGASNAVTGVGFQPDFSWIKSRDSSEDHQLIDSVREATKYIISNTTGAENTNAENLKSFDSDGFTLGTAVEVNKSADDFVSWNWKAGTTSGIAGSPSITPSGYSFNATSGFSIIEYTGNGVSGATLPHGLGAIPNCIIVKKTSATEHWAVYNTGNDEASPEDYYMQLNGTGNQYNNAAIWNDTLGDTTLFTVGNDATVNTNTATYIAYCFTNIPGFSESGHYIGNGNNDGPFIYTGFRPSWVMIKQASGSGTNGWYILDTKRIGYNPENEDLLANTTAAEDTSNNYLDLCGTGFKIRTDTGNMNINTSRYTYMAFGQSIVGSNGVIATAR